MPFSIPSFSVHMGPYGYSESLIGIITLALVGFIRSAISCLLIGEFNLFMFKLINDRDLVLSFYSLFSGPFVIHCSFFLFLLSLVLVTLTFSHVPLCNYYRFLPVLTMNPDEIHLVQLVDFSSIILIYGFSFHFNLFF